MKRAALYLFLLILVAIPLLILRPVPIVEESKALTITGRVTNIYEAGIKDVVFRIKDSPTRYYINRGLENGLDLQDLKERLTGEEVTIKYPKYWTPLDWNNEVKHLSKLEYKAEVIFNELK